MILNCQLIQELVIALSLSKQLKKRLLKNPGDKLNWSNLGVIQSNNPATVADAEASFKKSFRN